LICGQKDVRAYLLIRLPVSSGRGGPGMKKKPISLKLLISSGMMVSS